jgi:hypothetical protein
VEKKKEMLRRGLPFFGELSEILKYKFLNRISDPKRVKFFLVKTLLRRRF